MTDANGTPLLSATREARHEEAHTATAETASANPNAPARTCRHLLRSRPSLRMIDLVFCSPGCARSVNRNRAFLECVQHAAGFLQQAVRV